MAALIRTDSGTIAVSGDAMNNGWSATAGMPRLVFWNEDEARRSVGKILDHADVFYPGHDGPFQMETGNVHYLGKREIKVFCSPDPGKDTGLEGIPVSHEIVRTNVVRSVATV
jgi:glyoxylase-like metal-dependent hydrolase (beta-lactamase superfamily II)